MQQNNRQQDSQQTRAQKEGTSWLKIIGIFFGVIVGITIVVGVLAGVALNSLSDDRGARDAHRATDLNQIQIAISLYENETGQYPDSLSAIEESGGMTSIPTDPETNQPYEYARTNEDTKFCLGACMKTKEKSELPDNHSQQCVQQLDLTCENGTPFALDGTSRY